MRDGPPETVCEPGDMPLSQKLDTGLREVFVEGSRPSLDIKPVNWGVSYFCPACGIPTREEEGHVTCPDCGRRLDEFVYDLIELHPHA